MLDRVAGPVIAQSFRYFAFRFDRPSAWQRRGRRRWPEALARRFGRCSPGTRSACVLARRSTRVFEEAMQVRTTQARRRTSAPHSRGRRCRSAPSSDVPFRPGDWGHLLAGLPPRCRTERHSRHHIDPAPSGIARGLRGGVSGRPGGDLRTRREAELAEDVLDMPRGGALRGDQPRRDLRVAQPLSHERRHLPLARREGAGARRRPGRRTRAARGPAVARAGGLLPAPPRAAAARRCARLPRRPRDFKAAVPAGPPVAMRRSMARHSSANPHAAASSPAARCRWANRRVDISSLHASPSAPQRQALLVARPRRGVVPLAVGEVAAVAQRRGDA